MSRCNDLTPPRFTRRQALSAVAGALWLSALQASTRSKKGLWSTLDGDCERLIAERMAPGFAVSVTRVGQLIYSRGFGMSDIETATPVSTHSVFHIGSITKQFTGAAIALLHEDGKLEFDDKLARFLPDFPHADEITLRQMLTHTSGLGNYTDMDSRQAFMQAARVDYDEKQLLAAMRATSPLFVAKPGTTWAYSNTAFVLLGMVVEKASGESYPKFLEQRLFSAASLKNTAFDDAATVVPNRASGYTPDDKAPSGFDNASFISMTFPGAAGSLRSTTEDLCHWHWELLSGRILKADSLKEMMTPIRLNDGSLPTANLGPAKDSKPTTVEYGFGVEMGTYEGRRYVEHGGGINGFSAQLRSFPAEQISVACLCNCDFSGKPDWYLKSEGIRDAAASAALVPI